MPDLPAVLDWLTALPPATLLTAMALLAFLENVIPPIPADVLVAFGGFLAARAGASAWPPFLAVWIGNVGGALLMFWLGRRFGSAWTERRFHLASGGLADAKVMRWYERYGPLAFVASRFVPGVRAVVSPVAGALRVPFAGAAVAISLASAIWYGAITWVAFRAGTNWEVVAAKIGRIGRWSGGIAVAVAVWLAVAVWRARARGRGHGLGESGEQQ